MSEERNLVFCGDVHGKYRELIWKVCIQKGLKDTDIIILGDFGVGFTRDMDIEYKRSEPKLSKSGNCIYALRGNHDDPEYFKDASRDYPRLKFLQDHTLYTFGGNLGIYVIGGAHSTDANLNPEFTGFQDRVIENKKRLSKGKLPVWWESEGVTEKYTDLPSRVDIIVSHTAPLRFEPIPIRTAEISTSQYTKIIKERKYLDYILQEVKADYWFYGHYHRSYSGTYNGLLYRGLEELELFQSPEKKNLNPQGELKDE